MIDYEKIFSSMLEEEGGEERLSEYLDEIARSANKAIEMRSTQKKKELVTKKIAAIFEEWLGDWKIFANDAFKPIDAAESIMNVLELIEKYATNDSLRLEDVLSEILK